MYLIVRNLGSLINFFLEDIMTIHKFKPWHYLLRKYISVAKWGWEPSIYWRNIGEIGDVLGLQSMAKWENTNPGIKYSNSLYCTKSPLFSCILKAYLVINSLTKIV